MVEILVTTTPDSPFVPSISKIDAVSGFRFNTGYNLKGDKKQAVLAFKQAVGTKDLWVDLKCRELKLTNAVDIVPGNQVLELNHKVTAKLPAVLYFNEGKKYVEIDQINDGNKLHVRVPKGRPDFKISFGKGTSFNMPDAMVIDEYLTPRDVEFVKIARDLDLHKYCLSFVEDTGDIESMLRLDPEAEIIAKIESIRGLEFIKSGYRDFKDRVRLLAARGDMYIELDRPHDILKALHDIIGADPNAIGASRLLLSVVQPGNMPTCADMCDIGFLLKLGYKAFLLGDEVCETEAILKSAIGILFAIQQSYDAGNF
nr:pyruvate kinase [Candidatus Sigynarchaeota archaeon]